MDTRKRPRSATEPRVEREEQLSGESSCSGSNTFQSADSSLSSEEESSPAGGPSTADRRAKAKDLHREGKSRRPYRKRQHLESSFEDTDISIDASSEPSDWNENVRKSCAPVLLRGMKRQGSRLTRRKSIKKNLTQRM